MSEMNNQQLTDALLELRRTLGDATLRPTEGTNDVDLPNGQACVLKSLYQLHVALDLVFGTPTTKGIIASMQEQIDYQARRIGSLTDKVLELEQRPPASSDSGSSSGCAVPLRAPDGAVAIRETRPNNGRRLTEGVLSGVEIGAAQVFDSPVAFMAEVGFGGAPIRGKGITLRKGGEIASIVRVPRDQTQEKDKDRIRVHTFSANPYDNGMRLIMGAVWIDGIPYFNADDPIVRILGMDGAGKTSKSTEDYSQDRIESCQDWCIWEDEAEKMFWFQACKAGWGVGVVGSTQSMNLRNPTLNDRKLKLIEPIIPSRDIRKEDYQD